MRVKFWGTRGSLPVALDAFAVERKVRRALELAVEHSLDSLPAVAEFMAESLSFPIKHTYGGNTACVQIESGSDEFVICDMGSGLRVFAQDLMEKRGAGPFTFNLFLSHVHWDHIMGFPFFVHAYIPGNTVRIFGSHDVLEQVIRAQNSAPCFPVPFDVLGANIEFVLLDEGKARDVAGLRVTNMRTAHGGDSYAYRFESADKALVFSTDAEHKIDAVDDTSDVVTFFRDADLVIFDAMYSLAESVSVKEDWGHSSNIVGVDLCHLARAKHYCMFHHEPIYDDDMIHHVLEETIRYEQLVRDDHELKVTSAYDGLVIDL
jgi:phosphoribosyl 1,2-cyclic phosphodiesterase